MSTEISRNIKGLVLAKRSKKQYDFVYKIPYVNEGFTRIVQKKLADLDINARVVAVAGVSLQQLFKPPKINRCACQLCSSGIRCSAKHVIYEAMCKMCHKCYDGVCNRPLICRLREHERSTRSINCSTALGEHIRDHIINEDGPIPIYTIVDFLISMRGGLKGIAIDKSGGSVVSTRVPKARVLKPIRHEC